MKTVMSKEGEIKRVDNATAKKLTDSAAWKYCPKSTWKNRETVK